MEKHFSLIINGSTRLDKLLATIFPEFTRNYIQMLCEKEKIVVNGKNANKKQMLTARDVVDIYFPREQLDLQPEDIDIDIVYQNDDFAVINKDAYINVHPVSWEWGRSGTLVNALLHHLGELSVINGVERPGIVHRLDKETSGLIVIAKNDKTMQELQRKFQEKEITKIYTALVVGAPRESEWVILSEIGRDRMHRKRMTTKNPINPKYAETHYKVLSEHTIGWDIYSLLEVDLKTGRTHQIRVHMASIGHPIVADQVYGMRKVNAYFEKEHKFKRQFLHASHMEFELFGEKYSFDGELKGDLVKVAGL